MKTYLDCFPCFIEQALRSSRIACNDDKIIKKVIDETGSMLKDISMDTSPPETGELIYRKIRELTKVEDPYKALKLKDINDVKSILPELKLKISNSENPLLTAIRLAIAGNVIDMGVSKQFNIFKDLETILVQDFATFHFNEFKETLAGAKNILYLGDNAGESVFDKLLIEELGKPVTYVVRGIPIINDVTYEDAINSDLHEVAEIISSGTTAPGTVLKLCSNEFIERFNKADLIISKGQGNYEALSGTQKPVFFLLKAKCKIIAEHLNVKENDIILKSANLNTN